MAGSIKLSVDSDLDLVALVARAVRAICVDLLAPEDIDSLEIGLVEAINNVIKHGYRGAHGNEVAVEVSLHSDRVILEVIDKAPSMKPELITDASTDRFAFDPEDLAKVPEDGMGLALIRLSMDEVTYIPGARENRLRLAKYFRR
ncbi:MAG: ATP-binding protein [Dehalococcoidia bacterium]